MKYFNLLKKVVYLTVFLASISVLAIVITPQLPKTRSLIYYSPCYETKKYRIGSIDSRFGISQAELLEDLKEASSVWNKTYGGELLAFDEKAKLIVNLVYDKRQELNSRIDELDKDLKERKNEIDPKLAEYNRKSEEFNKKLEAFNTEVRKWNSEGGAPQDVYDKLIKEQESLKAEAEELNKLAKQLGQSTNEYNKNVDMLNQTVNNFGQVISGKPEEGLYEQDGQKETITIYIHNTKQELIHTLAHEFGHALGLPHVEGTDSIMHAKTNDAITPSVEDTEELKKICKERLISEVIIEHYKNVFEYLRSGKKLTI